MIEQIWENRDITVENVLQESKQNLSDLKKEIKVYDDQENLDLSQKIPPKLKDIYKKLLKINSKKDVKNIQLDWRELEIFLNLFQVYSNTKLGSKVAENFRDIFGVQGNMTIHQENFKWIKLITISVGQQELFSINHTTPTTAYSSWKLWNTPVVVERSSDRYYLKDIEGNKIEGRVSFLPDGNMMPIDENGVFHQQTILFWDLSFNKWANENFTIAPTKSPEAMLTYKYEKKKEKIWRMEKVTSLENMWYILDRDDASKTVRIKKNNIKSKYSESLLSYKSDNDFLKWLEDAKKSIDSGVMEVEKQEAKFEDFYNKYFNTNATYMENTRYEIIRDQWTKFYLIDKQNKNKQLTNNPVSIFDERGRLLEERDIDAMIEKYEAEQIYLKFIAKNNSKDAVNIKWEHVGNEYYLWYPFIYKSHTIKLERTPFTDWKYAILINEQETETFKWKIFLDNFMSASDIEKEINKLIK